MVHPAMLDPGCGGENSLVLIHVEADNVQSKVDDDGVLVLVRRGKHRDHVLVVPVQQVSEAPVIQLLLMIH